MLSNNEFEAGNKIYPFTLKEKLTDDEKKEMDQIYKNYTTARDAIQESEYFRLKLYSSITKSIKSIGRNIKGTVKYGLKDIGEQLTKTGRYDGSVQSTYKDGLDYIYKMNKK